VNALTLGISEQGEVILYLKKSNDENVMYGNSEFLFFITPCSIFNTFPQTPL
jgi:hypothetical protein